MRVCKNRKGAEGAEAVSVEANLVRNQQTQAWMSLGELAVVECIEQRHETTRGFPFQSLIPVWRIRPSDCREERFESGPTIEGRLQLNGAVRTSRSDCAMRRRNWLREERDGREKERDGMDWRGEWVKRAGIGG